jgi:pSer/pThr/pTyr-binding forkhead associated (FHA) protein
MTPGRQYLIGKDRVVIGRHSGSKNVIPDLDLGDQLDDTIHSEHAAVIREGEQLFLEDLGNRNAAAVNNRRLKSGERILLRSGDRIRVGNTVLAVL